MAHLICWAVSGEWPTSASSQQNPQQSVKASILKLNQEPGKKSKFTLDTTSTSNNGTSSSEFIDKPARLVIQLQPDDETPSTLPLNDVDASKTPAFFLGGFQIVGNFRHSEVYITDSDGKETYLMTSKGIPFQKPTPTSDSTSSSSSESEVPMFKAVCVVPGGPRQVHRLTIKLLSVKPASQTQISLSMLQLTGRIPPAALSAPSASSTSPTTDSLPASSKASGANASLPTQAAIPSSSQQSPAPSVAAANTSTAMSQADLGAAMASMSILARATEENISKTVGQQFQSLSTNLQTSLLQQMHMQQQQHLQLKLSNDTLQKSMQEFQQNVLQQNQLLMQSMSDQMTMMLEQQQALTQTVAQLQSEVQTLRQALTEQQERSSHASPRVLDVAGEQCDSDGTSTNASSNGNNDNTKPATETSTDDEDILERGIEHTLSNLELVAENEDSEDETDAPSGTQPPATTLVLRTPENSSTTKEQTDDDVGEQENEDDGFLAETIEVTLLHDHDSEQPLQEQVHQTLPTINPSTTTGANGQPSSSTATSSESTTARSVMSPPPNDPSIPQITRSFEDRNDKSHTKESDEDALDAIDIELMQGDMNETVELIGEPSTDHERNPPEVQEGNLLDL